MATVCHLSRVVVLRPPLLFCRRSYRFRNLVGALRSWVAAHPEQDGAVRLSSRLDCRVLPCLCSSLASALPPRQTSDPIKWLGTCALASCVDMWHTLCVQEVFFWFDCFSIDEHATQSFPQEW